MTNAHPILSDPFDKRYDVTVAGGALHVAHAGAPPGGAGSVVLALHGATASLMTWRTVAREITAQEEDVCFLAPDLRGRGRSAGLPGPYGIAAHVEDLIAVLDDAGVERAILVGHSLGGYVAARMAADRPERTAALVLLDGGVPFPAPSDPRAMLDEAVGVTALRLAITFPSVDAYVAGWQTHPALTKAWNDDLEAYARYDLVQRDDRTRCVVSAQAVHADTTEVVLDEMTRLALDHVDSDERIQMLRAERGLFDEKDTPVIAPDLMRAFAADHPGAYVEEVPDVNHYTLVMGDSPGPARVAAAIERARQAVG
jgi:pimeloyl-ACP methyl ester carboxylesterase